ncbi:unnamed protein product [Diamesa tonsa]
MGSLPQLSIVKGSYASLTPKFLHKVFEERVDQEGYGEKIAMIFKDEHGDERKINYNTLNSTSNRIASSLLNTIKLNDLHANQDNDFIVAVCMQPSDNLVTTLLAIWKCGAAYLPLDVTFPANRIEHILGESKPVLVIIDDNFDRPEVFGTVKAIKFNELKKESLAFSNANIDVSETLTEGLTDLGLVLYTSGSTGVPKGVRVPQSIVQNRLEWQWKRFPYSPTEIYGIFKTALTFVDSVSEIWGPLLNGLTVVVVPKEVTKDPQRLVDMLEEYKIERLVLVPTLLRSLLMFLSLQDANADRLLMNLKIWVCSGEPLSITLSKEFYDYFEEGIHVLCNFYGSTEVMGDVTYFVCESKKQLDSLERVPIGYPVDNTVIYLLDSDFRPVKNDSIGELFVSGANLAAGYVNGRDPDRFIDNPLAVDPQYSRLYRTGDYASLDKGIIYYEGRTDSQIKIRGHRVDLSEVEKNITSLGYVDKGIVLCYHAGEIDQALLAFVILSESDNKYKSKTGMQIENELKDTLASYMIPQVIVLETIPLLVNGKVDRQGLLKMYENTNNNDDSAIEIEMDYNGIEENQLDAAKELFDIVGQSIGRSIRSKLTISSNFYELGGNSLNSIFTVTQLRNKGYFISITDFITASSLRVILDKITNVTSSNGTDSCQKCDLVIDCDLELVCLPLAYEHKADTIDIITTSFYEKADIEHYIKDEILRTDYSDILEMIWDVLIEKDLSFIIKDSTGRSVGVSLNFDAHDEPLVNITSRLIVVFEFLEFLEGPIRDNKLPKGLNQILHSFMMTTSADLNAKENIAVMHFMENEVLRLATRKEFTGILTTNTSPLTQQLGSDVYGYKTMLEYPINQYTYHDGTNPFGKAPDSKTVIVHWKNITEA